ncbi:hypothetical protein [Streptosporangium sp. KLBMP 9127]|nr:hypothetical protein [Streptosporangium sp. KLBMP 9127]
MVVARVTFSRSVASEMYRRSTDRRSDTVPSWHSPPAPVGGWLPSDGAASSATGSQLPGYAGAAAHAIWIVGAQKVVADLPAALRRVEEHCLPLENDRAMRAYGKPSALNRLLILNAEPYPGRGTVLLLRETIGF